ncbi:hypothetical protein ElyMa_003052200 [Elysia marginata]|uniref:Sulfotransferase domain-containing protein n=1 Tax=Elysia marginata TaxID=1093978 RepID=A0AAV4IJB7_9GAST|nr:hypothetical protein ElyMa_003052200 [Elysia marginata]
MRSLSSNRYWYTFLFLLVATFASFAVTFFYNSGIVVVVEDKERLPPTVGPSSDKVQTLLVTFGRSGSSFTSDIIAHNKEVFYTFEPLSFMSRTKEVNRVPMYFQT